MADLNTLNLILSELLICACDALENGLAEETGSNCGCPCRAFITAGTPVMDLESCCGDGQLSVYLNGDLFPFSNFPNRGGAAEVCSSALAANVSVQLLRCWPANIGDDGRAPTHLEIQAASEAIHRDLYLLTWGLICCLQPMAKKRRYILNGGRIIGPTGGCVGAEVSLVIELTDIN